MGLGFLSCLKMFNKLPTQTSNRIFGIFDGIALISLVVFAWRVGFDDGVATRDFWNERSDTMLSDRWLHSTLPSTEYGETLRVEIQPWTQFFLGAGENCASAGVSSNLPSCPKITSGASIPTQK